MIAAPICGFGHGPMKARKGKYGNFWSCGVKDANGVWCQFKPAKNIPPPDAENMFSADLDKSKASEEKSVSDAKRSDDMSWGNAKNCASVLLAANIAKSKDTVDGFNVMKEFSDLAILIYKMPKPE
jgi:hypothetical protein